MELLFIGGNVLSPSQTLIVYSVGGSNGGRDNLSLSPEFSHSDLERLCPDDRRVTATNIGLKLAPVKLRVRSHMFVYIVVNCGAVPDHSSQSVSLRSRQSVSHARSDN
eukprot:5685784-Heterocapsa_arctica.AAC.1